MLWDCCNFCLRGCCNREDNDSDHLGSLVPDSGTKVSTVSIPPHRRSDWQSQIIQKNIKEHSKREEKLKKNSLKIMLVGCGQAGKSTFIKQMQLIHGMKYSDKDRFIYKRYMAANILTSILELDKHKTEEYNKREHFLAVNELFDIYESELEQKNSQSLDPEILYSHAENIAELWNQKNIQDAYLRRNKFQLQDSAQNFLNRVTNILNNEYVLTDNDIILTRVQTTEIFDYHFILKREEEKKDKGQMITIIDLGGQRNQRPNWLGVVDNIYMLLFLAAVSEYDQVLAENTSINRMQESLDVFSSLVSFEYLDEKNVVLFLNKKDLLKEKICNSHIDDYFQDFPGPRQDYDAAIAFFSEKFIQQDRGKFKEERKIFIHATCATDRQNMMMIDAVLSKTILDGVLKMVMLN